MEIAIIQGEARKPGGRHANRRLRKRGLVPAVIYGHEQTPETVALSRHDLLLALKHAQHVVKVAVGKQRTQYLIKDVQFDHLQQEPIHTDLMRVDLDERVRRLVDVGVGYLSSSGVSRTAFTRAAICFTSSPTSTSSARC